MATTLGSFTVVNDVLLKAPDPMDVTLVGIDSDVTGTLSNADAAIAVTPSGTV